MGRDFIAKFNMSSKLMFAPGVSMLEDCEGSMMWQGSGTGADWSVDFSDTDCLFGQKCLRMVTRVTDAEVGDLVIAERCVPVPEGENIVLRGKMAIPEAGTVDKMRVFMYCYFGGKKFNSGLEWRPTPKTVGVMNSVGGFDIVDGLGSGLVVKSWLDYEVAVDRGTGRYRYVGVNGVRSIQTGLMQEVADPSNLRMLKLTMTVYAAVSPPATLDFDAIYVGSHD